MTPPSSTTSVRARRRNPRRPTTPDQPPLPSSHPHRSPDRGSGAGGGDGGLWNGVGTHWASLQTLASSVLGSDAVTATPKPGSGAGWLSELLAPTPASGSASTSASGRGDIYPRARRRPVNGTAPTTTADERRRRKRVSTSPSPPSSPHEHHHRREEAEQEALVYIHPVSATTTTEGVVIAFDTTAAAIRRANGLWPGDSLQSRKELLVPVDECRVKGTPIADPPPPPDKPELKRHFTDPPPAPVEAGPAEDEDAPYRAVSRVLLPGIGPTVIARLKRKKLSHFPPPRHHAHPSHTPRPPATAATAATPTLRGQTPGVHSLHPERADTGGAELVESIATGVGAVEGWIRGWGRRVREGGGEVFEMVAQMGVEEEERLWRERRELRRRQAEAVAVVGAQSSTREAADEGRERRKRDGSKDGGGGGGAGAGEGEREGERSKDD
ncbi:hypothetical protein EDC01DRAFT_387090 [Geopyxis carbonaria]|nr:hypothetical protein EDC01DRAFT_387090 [Geopyxis carbonaria]